MFIRRIRHRRRRRRRDGEKALSRVDEAFEMLHLVEMRSTDSPEAPDGAEESAGDDAGHRPPTSVEAATAHQLGKEKGTEI